MENKIKCHFNQSDKDICLIGLNLMIKPVLVIWQDTSFVPVSLRKDWFIFRQKNLIVVLPRLFTHLRTENPEKFLMLWTGLPGW